MHAVIGGFAMDPERLNKQRQELHGMIIPMVKELPGFVTGYWSYQPGDSKSYSYIVFETEAQARRLVEVVRANGAQQHAAGVELGWLEVVEIWGQAGAGQAGT